MRIHFRADISYYAVDQKHITPPLSIYTAISFLPSRSPLLKLQIQKKGTIAVQPPTLEGKGRWYILHAHPSIIRISKPP